MARIILEDMKFNRGRNNSVPKQEKVLLPKKPRKITRNIEEEVKEKNYSKIDNYFKSKYSHTERLQRTPQIKSGTKAFNKYILVFFIACLIGGGIYWGGNIYQKADIVITSKHQLINYINKQFVASKDLSDNAIEFEIMIISDKKVKNIILTGTKDVTIKAKGSITLYNEFGITSQNLLAGTFVSDSSGKAYKTDIDVTIPGYKIENKKLIPGQVDVSITSFLAGESYNDTSEDFFINSFKSTTKYKKIYGKLKSPLIGGAQGLVYTIDDTNLTNINNIAQSSLKTDLLKKVEALVPPGYILYPNSMTFSYKTGDSVFSKTPQANVEIEGILSVVLLNEKSLMDNIIKIYLPQVSESEVKEIQISNLNKLSFNFTNKDQQITKELNSFPFYFSGDIDAIWKPDIEMLKSKLLGINRNEISPLFRKDPGISSATVKIFPPWQKFVPDDISKINIILN